MAAGRVCMCRVSDRRDGLLGSEDSSAPRVCPCASSFGLLLARSFTRSLTLTLTLRYGRTPESCNQDTLSQGPRVTIQVAAVPWCGGRYCLSRMLSSPYIHVVHRNSPSGAPLGAFVTVCNAFIRQAGAVILDGSRDYRCKLSDYEKQARLVNEG